MVGSRKVFIYEAKNLFRSRWVVVWSGFVFLLTLLFIRIAGDLTKATLSLFTVLLISAPLIALLNAAAYWYYTERFTQLVLTLPIQRNRFFWARWWALNVALVVSCAIGIIPPFLYYGSASKELFCSFALVAFLLFTFSTIGMWIGITVSDRMKGLGIVLGIWLYLALLHDGAILVLLVLFKDYPLDVASAVAAALNPISLVRLTLLLQYDAPLLLGQTEAAIRRTVTSTISYGIGALIASCWIVIPAFMAQRKFRRLDF